MISSDLHRSASCRATRIGWRRVFAVGTLLTLLCSWTACTRESRVDPPSPTSKRTILAYLAGDNNLSGEVAMKCAALLSGWKPGYGELLILADDDRTEHPVLIRAVVRGDRAVPDTIRRYTSMHSSASPVLLRQAVTDMQSFAPAESYGLLLFSHATGWLPPGAFVHPERWHPVEHSESLRSIFADHEEEMSLADFATAIPDGVFRFIAMDMCFMADVQVLYALRHKSEFVVASAAEILSPGFVPIYPEHLSRLYLSTPDLVGFARVFFDYFDHKDGLYQSATISVVRMAEMDRVAQLTQELSKGAVPVDLSALQHYDRRTDHHLFFDLGDYLHYLARSDADHRRIDEVLADCVVYKANTNRLIELPIRSHSGLSVYIPQPSLPPLNTAHRSTEWGQTVCP